MLCALRWLISRPQNLIPRSRNQIREKLLPSRKLRYFRGSRFQQCFILSTSLQCSLIFVLSNYQTCTFPLTCCGNKTRTHSRVLIFRTSPPIYPPLINSKTTGLFSYLRRRVTAYIHPEKKQFVNNNGQNWAVMFVTK